MRLNFKRLALLGGHAARAYGRMIGLTSARMDLVLTLCAGELAQIELAALLCVSPPVVSRMLRALEELGWIQRRRLLRDRRRKIVRLTEWGRAQLEAMDDRLGPSIDGSETAQGEGERMWTSCWNARISRLGVELLGMIAQFYRGRTPPYREIQRWNRRTHFDAWLSWDSPFEEPSTP